jgi:hypothetical protein
MNLIPEIIALFITLGSLTADYQMQATTSRLNSDRPLTVRVIEITPTENYTVLEAFEIIQGLLADYGGYGLFGKPVFRKPEDNAVTSNHIFWEYGKQGFGRAIWAEDGLLWVGYNQKIFQIIHITYEPWKPKI